MGEFTQNLLKLTEFPFSYSLIGLFALIFGHGINLEQLSFARVGPLLILMGYVATTLSICDPIGALQRRIIKRPDLRESSIRKRHWFIFRRPDLKTYMEDPNKFINLKIFGWLIRYYFPLPYIFAIYYSPEQELKDFDWALIKGLYEGASDYNEK